MSIPRYRIGNDLTVLWAINNKDGSPYDLSQKEVRLFVTHPRDKIEVEATIQTLQGGVINNVIRWDFSGLEQRVLGKYMLTAEIYTSENKKLIRKDISEAFALVSRSEMENEEGGDEVMDGGDLYLSSALDIYRFGIPRVRIGTDGFWYIDDVPTGMSALGGGPGLVKNIYTHKDLEKDFEEQSVIDTFNAFAVASLAKRVKFLEGDFYTQVRNLTDVFLGGNPMKGQALVWDGTYWTAQDIVTKSSIPADTIKIIEELRQLLDWFEYDSENNMLRSNFGLYSFGPIVAGGRINGLQVSAVNKLVQLKDVKIDTPKDGESLVYDEDSSQWINGMVEGGDASLEAAVTAEVAVGYISKNITLTKGMTFTEFVQLMFSQDIKKYPPTVTLEGVPNYDIEVGTSVVLNLTSSYKDGYFANTKDGKTQAGCEAGAATFYLDNAVIEVPYTLATDSAKVYAVSVRQSYGDSTAEVINKAGQTVEESISAGTATAQQSFTVGYRAFWGYMTDDEAENLTSELVRGLEHSDTIIDPTKGKITLLQGDDTVPAGQDLMIAIPSSYILSEVVNKDDINFAEGFALSPLTVQCAGDAEASYNVYRYDNQSAYPMDITKITIEEA